MATRSTWRRTRARARSSPTTPTSPLAPPLSQTPTRCGASADMVLKVKEPIAEEYHRMRPGLTLFTYLHLAADKACTDALLDEQGHRHRLRDRPARRRLPPAACPDVRGGRPPRPAGRRLPPDALRRRLRRAARRRPRHLRLQRRRHRRRRLRPARRADRGRHGRARHRPRPEHRPAPPHRRDLPGPDPDRRVQRLRDRAAPSSRPTWSSARCSSPGPRRPSWSPTSSSPG